MNSQGIAKVRRQSLRSTGLTWDSHVAIRGLHRVNKHLARDWAEESLRDTVDL